jgi:large subunit ribosomal protein L22
MTATYNARPGAKPATVARVRFVRMSATKARTVLDLIRGTEVKKAEEILRFCERDAALVIGKLLRSAVANAEHNDDQIAEDLFVSACYADEGRTIRRFRPRARGRATRIRKRTCHITIEVKRLSEEQLERRRTRKSSRPTTRTSRRAAQEATAETTGGRTRRRRSKPKAGAPATPTQPEPEQTDEPAAMQASEPEHEPDPTGDDEAGLFAAPDESETQAMEVEEQTPGDPPQSTEEEER